MGTFEKLGILVIVVIIVMILAVAISQWGGIATQPDGPAGEFTTSETTKPLKIVDIDPPCGPQPPPSTDPDLEGSARSATWPGGIPKVYEIQKGDKVWVLVVKRWRLKESFVPAILSANPRINFSKLQLGTKLVIPDPGPYRRGAKGRVGGARLYQLKVGDTLESIAKIHLGSKNRWREILALNPGLNTKRLKPGRKINVPVK